MYVGLEVINNYCIDFIKLYDIYYTINMLMSENAWDN